MDAPTQNTLLTGTMVAGAVAAIWAFGKEYFKTQRDRKHAKEDLESQERREATAQWQQYLTTENLALRSQVKEMTERIIELERQGAKDLQLFSDAVTRLEQRLAASSLPPRSQLSPQAPPTGSATPELSVSPKSRPQTEPRLPAPPPLPRTPRTRS